MENSAASSSSPIKALSYGDDDRAEDSAEESGWTEYLEDFEAYNNGERVEYDDADHVQEDVGNNKIGYTGCSSFMSGSMVSDAGSGPEWKQRNLSSTNNNHLGPHHHQAMWSGLPNLPKKLCFKKKRTQEISCDDSLEDTASSPVNSPKITMNFKRMDINSRKTDDNHESYTGKATSISEHREFKMTSEMQGLSNNNHDHETDDYYKDLEKKGLCLVPVSMFMNYVD